MTANSKKAESTKAKSKAKTSGAKAKVTTATRRAVKRERVAMVKAPVPSAPVGVEVVAQPAPVVMAAEVVGKVAGAKVSAEKGVAEKNAAATGSAAAGSAAEDEYEGLQAAALQRPLGVAVPSTRHRRRRVAVLEGFSLHADTAVHGHDRAGLGRLCRYGARGPVSEARLEKLDDGRYRYSPKKGAAFTVTAAVLVKRLVALLPPPNRHLTSFHGVFAPNARLRPLALARPPPEAPEPPRTQAPSAPSTRRQRIDWATLHRRSFGTEVLRCPCGGTRTVNALHATRKAAEERLAQLGIRPPSLLLPPPTAPPQLALGV